jgi:hypothetical protein
MKLSFVVLLVAACFAAYAQQASPRMLSVDPMNGKTGDVITVSGENLQKELVAKLFLTDDKIDILCEITEQTATSLKFKIPAKVEKGARLALMVETAGKDKKQIIQPVKVTIAEE